MEQPLILEELYQQIHSFLERINQTSYWKAMIDVSLGHILIHQLKVNGSGNEVKIEQWNIDDVDALKDNFYISTIDHNVKGHEYKNTIMENITKSDRKDILPLLAVELDLEGQRCNDNTFESSLNNDAHESNSLLEGAPENDTGCNKTWIVKDCRQQKTIVELSMDKRENDQENTELDITLKSVHCSDKEAYAGERR